MVVGAGVGVAGSGRRYVDRRAAGIDRFGQQRQGTIRIVEGDESHRQQAGAEELVAETELVYGDPAEALLGFTTTLDLLVMGSRAYGPRRAVMLGGVSRKVTAAARCPVIVLPRGAERSLGDLVSA